MQRQDRFSAEDFFDNDQEREIQGETVYYTEGSLAVEPARPEAQPRRHSIPERKKLEKKATRTRLHIRKADEEAMARVKSKFSFFLCSAFVLAGCLSIVLAYIQVFNREAQISDLQSQLAELQSDNEISASNVAEQMTLADLYSYATGELGMVEPDGATTIQVTVANQSYTSSSLPIQNASESKVTFHWLG